MLRPFSLLSAVTLRGTHPPLVSPAGLPWPGSTHPPTPLPRPYRGDICCLAGAGGGCYIYNLIPKEGCAPFDNPL